MKKYKSDEIEYVTITITKSKYPIIFETKVRELIGNGLSRKDAELSVEGMQIDLELYYEKDYGLFGVESEALEYGDIRSPYSGGLLEQSNME